MGDHNRSKSYGGSGTMQMDNYYGPPRAPPPPTSYELTNYSASYAQAQMGNYPYNYNNRDLKKGKAATVSRSKSSSWALSDPELQRKKRVASYKMYAVEGKMKGSFRKSFRWLKAIRYIVKKMDPKLEVKIKEATKLIAEMSQDKLRFKYSLQMVHGSKSLTKEKQLLKDMKLSQQDDKFVTFWTQLEQELEMQLRKVILKPLLITMESTEMWNCKASDYDAMVKNNVNANAAWKGIISSSSGLKKPYRRKLRLLLKE